MSDHTGMVVIGEPVLATRVLFQRTLGALFTVLAATSVSAILELLCDGPVGAVISETVRQVGETAGARASWPPGAHSCQRCR